MRKACFGALHRLVWWSSDRGIHWIGDAIYDYICPYPIDGNYSMRSCRRAGNCGCRQSTKRDGE
jgi:hypothetical protein